MEFWLFSFFILFAIVLQRRLSDANPNVTLMGNGHFQDGQDLVLTCRVDVNVDLLSVSFFKGISETIWINDPVSCTFFNLVPDGTSRYNTTCNPTTNTFTMIKYALKFSDDKTVWSCQMKSNTGGTGPCVGANNPCISGYITLKLDDTTSASPSTDCALASFLGLALGVGLGSAAICIICLIVIWVKTCKTEKLAVDIDIGKTLRQHGSDVKIICSVYGSEKKSVDWTGQEENQLTDVGRCTIASFDSSTNKSSLIIRTSSMTKTEGYICQVAFRKSGVSVKIYITITVLDNGSLKVSIEKIILFVPASENERRKWIGPQKTVLPNTGRYTIVPYDSITNESHITIKNFSMNDHGSYTCQPQNSSVSSPEKSITITTNDAANPNKGASKLIIGFGFGIIVVVCIVCVVILVLIGERCVLKFAIGLGLGLGIPGVGCIIVIVILVKKGFKKPSASENGNVKSGSRSDVSRKDVEIQMEDKGVKNNDERPLVNHNRIRNKDDSEAEQVLSKPFDPKERRPLPPLNKEVKDKPTHYSQTIPSGNDVKDKNSRGLSANFDDTQGLASEMTRPSKLPPIESQVQATVQEEDTSEGPKKTKKNKRKKEKTNEEKHTDKTAK